MTITDFEERLLEWASAACREWGYPEPGGTYLDLIRARLPGELMETLELGIQEGVLVTKDHRFTLGDSAAGKGPYAWFSRSQREVPAPNWEYFVQAATFARLHAALAFRGYSLVFEDDLMDIAIYEDGRLVVCCEVKEKAAQLDPLLSAIKGYESGVDFGEPDRHNDGLRKAKYILRSRPEFFALVAIGQEMHFRVGYPEQGAFRLLPDEIPAWYPQS